MSKEQLYSVYIQFKEGQEAVSVGNRRTTSAEVIGNALVTEGYYYTNGKGKIIYSLDTIDFCSIIPLSPEENEEQLKTIKGEA